MMKESESESQCLRKSGRNEVTFRTGVRTNQVVSLYSPL
jgi:hypothetical protein